MTVSREALNEHIRGLNGLMRAHAGSIEVTGVSESGVVTIAFEGKCTGCDLKAVTMAATIRPTLLAIEGVTAVIAPGMRISEEAEQRLVEAIGSDEVRMRLLQNNRDRRRHLLPREPSASFPLTTIKRKEPAYPEEKQKR